MSTATEARKLMKVTVTTEFYVIAPIDYGTDDTEHGIDWEEYRDANHIEITVNDTGLEFAEENRSRFTTSDVEVDDLGYIGACARCGGDLEDDDEPEEVEGEGVVCSECLSKLTCDICGNQFDKDDDCGTDDQPICPDCDEEEEEE